MKTADLIPFILIELNESDKYGFELTKNIETKSNGKIIIKQPTLYTLLKKLEKSKFITSYWQDSDIGGKRHYYKITDNGKMQLSTLPSYDVILQNLLNDEENEDDENISNNNAATLPNTTEENDENIDPVQKTPLEAVLPTNEVFENSSIDTKTSAEINQDNANLLTKDATKNEETFATNIVVAKFVGMKPSKPPEIKQVNSQSSNNLVDLDIKISPQQNEIAYVDYVNLKKSKEYKKSKLFSKLSIIRPIIVSLFMIALLSIFAFTSEQFETSPLYYITLILGFVIAIFYPIITAINIDTIKTKFKKNNYKFNMKFSIITKFSILCFVLLIVLFTNISIKNNTFVKIFSINNFANFYMPIIFSLSMFIDSLIGKLISIKMNK